MSKEAWWIGREMDVSKEISVVLTIQVLECAFFIGDRCRNEVLILSSYYSSEGSMLLRFLTNDCRFSFLSLGISLSRIPCGHPTNEAEDVVVTQRFYKTSGDVRAVTGTADCGNVALFVKVDAGLDEL